MARRPVIVHLLGFPAVGKYTIAKQLAARWPAARGRMIVVDNHHVNNVLLSVLDVDGIRELPSRVWELTADVRSAVLTGIEELAPPELSYVFTNFLVADNPRHTAMVERVAGLAAARLSDYVPVRLHCSPDEIARRAPQPDRRERLKWVEPDRVRAVAESNRLVDAPYPNVLDLDVTDTAAATAAALILDHIAALP